jgi:hypothetical protein
MGPGSLDDILKAVSSQAEQPKYIRAYHGSPYDWDRVDMSMVGKGEGPLDEGFGLYATDAEGAANWYRSRTAFIRQRALADEMRRARGRLRSLPTVHRYDGASRTLVPVEDTDEYQRGLEALSRVRADVGKLQRAFPRGRTYELEIAHPRDSLMEYDVPVYAQQPEVSAKMRDIDPRLFDELVDAGLGGMDEANGGWFYNTLAGGTIFDSPTVAGQRRASEMLFEAGIPGHAYKNDNPNYVFYPGTEDQIRILRKYGLMAPVAAGAAQEQR